MQIIKSSTNQAKLNCTLSGALSKANRGTEYTLLLREADIFADLLLLENFHVQIGNQGPEIDW